MAYLGRSASPAGISKEFGRNPVGSGALKFHTWRANEAVVVSRNDNIQDGKADGETTVFRPITDGNTRVAEGCRWHRHDGRVHQSRFRSSER